MRSHTAVLTILALSLIAPAFAQSPPKLGVIGTIAGPDGGWDYASIDFAARRLYVAHGDAVMAVDLDSGAVTPKLVEGKRLHAVVPLPDGKVLSTNGGDNTATLFEAATGKVIASIPTGKGPDSAVFEPSTGLVAVMDGKDGTITVIDPKAAKALGSIDVGGSLEAATTDGHGLVYDNIEDRSEIAVVDVAARKLVTRYKLPGCDEPSGLAIDPDTGILVSACRNKVALAVEARNAADRRTSGRGDLRCAAQAVFHSLRRRFADRDFGQGRRGAGRCRLRGHRGRRQDRRARRQDREDLSSDRRFRAAGARRETPQRHPWHLSDRHRRREISRAASAANRCFPLMDRRTGMVDEGEVKRIAGDLAGEKPRTVARETAAVDKRRWP
jgi:YVTN family beta-propeller protein